MDKITNYVWDFDGTLFDSYPCMSQGFSQYLLSKGYTVCAEEIEKYFRISFQTGWIHYKEQFNLNEEELPIARQYMKEQESKIKIFPDCKDVLLLLKENGCHHYLLTHRGASALTIMKEAGILDLFTKCITIEDGYPRKPDPSGLYALMQEYDQDPCHWIMVGDRDLDLLAGKNAGMHTCLFVTEAKTDPALADYKFKEYKELPILMHNND